MNPTNGLLSDIMGMLIALNSLGLIALAFRAGKLVQRVDNLENIQREVNSYNLSAKLDGITTQVQELKEEVGNLRDDILRKVIS